MLQRERERERERETKSIPLWNNKADAEQFKYRIKPKFLSN